VARTKNVSYVHNVLVSTGSPRKSVWLSEKCGLYLCGLARQNCIIDCAGRESIFYSHTVFSIWVPTTFIACVSPSCPIPLFCVCTVVRAAVSLFCCFSSRARGARSPSFLLQNKMIRNVSNIIRVVDKIVISFPN
jgi:hypothetical protein